MAWDDATRTVSLSGKGTEVSLPVDGKTARINGRTVMIDPSAKIVQGRTLVPLRFISEAFGASVNWDQESQSVTIYPKTP